MKAILLAALLGTVALAPAAHAAPAHCDGHDSPDFVKVEGEYNDFVPPDGMEFCVKASTETTGLQTGDGTTSLIAFVAAAGIENDNGEPHDVSYYVVYNAGEEGTEPTVDADDGEEKAEETKPATVSVESDVEVDELGDTAGETAAGTAGGPSVAGVDTPAAADAGTTPTEPQTQVLGETLERGPGTLARTGAGVGGLAALGGLLCAGGFLARRLVGLL